MIEFLIDAYVTNAFVAYIVIQSNLSATTTSIIKFINCDLFSNVF